MSNQVISFIGQEKVGISQKMRAIPTFSFYSTLTIELTQPPAPEKYKIGHSYRSIAGLSFRQSKWPKECGCWAALGLVLLPISGIPYTERISGDLPLQENSQVFSLVGTRRAWTGCLLPDSGWERSWWWNARKITKSKKDSGQQNTICQPEPLFHFLIIKYASKHSVEHKKERWMKVIIPAMVVFYLLMFQGAE